MYYSWNKIKNTLVKELKPIFDDPNQPRYPFSFEDGLEVFCKTLLYKTGETNLDGIADKVIPTIDKYYHHKKDINDAFNFLTQIATKLDSFLQKLTFFFHNADYRSLKAGHKGMYQYLNKIGINRNNINFNVPINTVTTSALNSNFGTHLYKAYELRNIEAHTATDYSERQISELIQHSLVIYIYATFEYYTQLLGVVGGITIPADIEIIEIPKELTPPREYDIDSISVIGRETEINQLERLDTHDKILFLKGIGGIGKTTISKTYIKKVKAQFNHIIWLPFKDNVQNSFAHNNILIQNLNLDFKGSVGEREKFEIITNSLGKLPGKNLICLDDFSDENISDLKLLPLSQDWKIIITSRLNLRHSDGFKFYEIGVLDFNNSKALFAKFYTGNITDEDLMELLNLVSYHTLSIELLAKTLQTNFTIGGIKALTGFLLKETIKSEEWQVLVQTNHNTEDLNLKGHLLKTFSISTLSDHEKQILLYFSILPTTVFSGLELIDIFQIENKSVFIDTLNSLVKKGWIKGQGNNFSIHGVIQEVIKIKLTPTFDNCKDVIHGIINLFQKEQETKATDKIKYIPLAESVLKTIVSDETEFFFLNLHTAVAYKDSGNTQTAEIYGKRGLSIAEAKNDLNLLYQAFSVMGVIYRIGGNLEKSKDCYTKAIVLIEESGDRTFTVLQIYANYATLLEQLGTKDSFLKAQGLYELVIRETQTSINELGENDFLTMLLLNSKGSLGKVYSFFGNHEDAVKIQTEAFNGIKDKMGDSHYYLSITANNLGISYGNLGEYDESMKYHKIAVEIQEKILPENHHDLSISKSGLASAYFNSGDTPKAKLIFAEVLKIGEKYLSENHPTLARRKSNLAGVCTVPEEIELAKQLYEEAIKIDELNYGRDNPYVALNILNLAMLNIKENNTVQAISRLKEAYVTFLKHHGKDHEFTRNALYYLKKYS